MSAHEKVPNTWSTLAFSCEGEVRYMGLCTILSFFSGSLKHIRFNRESSSNEEPYFIILNYIVDVTLVTQSEYCVALSQMAHSCALAVL